MKLGFMSTFVKASSDALHLVPAVNAVIEGDELVYRDYTDISIAVAAPKGLVVPVLRNVDSLNFAGVEKASYSAQLHADAIAQCIMHPDIGLQLSHLNAEMTFSLFLTLHALYS